MSDRVTIRARRDHPHAVATGIDVDALVSSLRAATRGEVRVDAGGRALYSTDASNFRQIPLAVVVPVDVDDVVAAVGACRAHGAPITMRGGGTSLAGQTTNVAVVIDCSKYLNRVLEIDPAGRWARVQPGCVLDTLRDAAEAHGLTFAPDPATHDRNTLGGMIGNNSCGVHSVQGGCTADNVIDLEVLLYDGTRMTVGALDEDAWDAVIARGGRAGEVHAALRSLRDAYEGQIRTRFPDLTRRVSGYGLDALLPDNGGNVAAALTGTEGTCVVVLEARLRLVPSPPARSLLVLGYPSIADAGGQVPALLEHRPIGLEGMDALLVDHMQRKDQLAGAVSLLPEGNAYLLLEFGGDTTAAADGRARDVMASLAADPAPPTMSLFDDPARQRELWSVRESALGATARVPGEPDTWPGWEDSAVPVAALGAYLVELRDLLDRYDLKAAVYGHFGGGCVHCRIPFDLMTGQGIARYRAFLHEAARLVVRHGGSLSGEHGDGQQRAALLELMFGAELVEAFRRFKAIWDPDGRMNPGKVVDPIRVFEVDENLRLGADYRPWVPETHFAFPDDGGSFERAAARCVGVGLCRRDEGGLMCPSFMATHEEQDSTRGRARVLFEMLQGEVIADGWRSEAVADALDLCLSCKGCKRDCPVNVDMATYKAEFLAHHHARRLRPRAAYSLGLIMLSAPVAARLPRLANFVTSAPVIGRALKAAAGVAPMRPAPRFAPRAFRAAFQPTATGGAPVLLYTDTFTNYFEPHIAGAAAEVLAAAGYQVSIPPATVCCGRPLYDYGMLPTARRFLRHNLRVLAPALRAGTPIVVLEPSCAATFRDELPALLPHDPDAARLRSQVVTLAELLGRHDDLELRSLDAPVRVWSHCHERSVLEPEAGATVLRRFAADVEPLAGTCCGLAGSWGFEAAKYDLSMAIGARGLFPAVRDAGDAAIVVADGFSCRTQLAHGTGRRAYHLAEVVRDQLAGRARTDPP